MQWFLLLHFFGGELSKSELYFIIDHRAYSLAILVKGGVFFL